MAALTAILGLAQGFLGFAAAMSQASATQEAANYKAMMEERRANEERAVGTRKAADQNKKTQYAQSKLQALAAASGGSASDPGTIDLSANIEGLGRLQALTEVYTGESRARNWENQAALTQFQGEQDAKALELKGYGTILGSIGGLAGNLAKYG